MPCRHIGQAQRGVIELEVEGGEEVAVLKQMGPTDLLVQPGDHLGQRPVCAGGADEGVVEQVGDDAAQDATDLVAGLVLEADEGALAGGVGEVAGEEVIAALHRAGNGLAGGEQATTAGQRVVARLMGVDEQQHLMGEGDVHRLLVEEPAQLGVAFGQLGGALDHPVLEVGVGAPQRLLGLFAAGLVDEEPGHADGPPVPDEQMRVARAVEGGAVVAHEAVLLARERVAGEQALPVGAEAGMVVGVDEGEEVDAPRDAVGREPRRGQALAVQHDHVAREVELVDGLGEGVDHEAILLLAGGERPLGLLALDDLLAQAGVGGGEFLGALAHAVLQPRVGEVETGLRLPPGVGLEHQRHAAADRRGERLLGRAPGAGRPDMLEADDADDPAAEPHGHMEARADAQRTQVGLREAAGGGVVGGIAGGDHLALFQGGEKLGVGGGVDPQAGAVAVRGQVEKVRAAQGGAAAIVEPDAHPGGSERAGGGLGEQGERGVAAAAEEPLVARQGGERVVEALGTGLAQRERGLGAAAAGEVAVGAEQPELPADAYR